MTSEQRYDEVLFGSDAGNDLMFELSLAWHFWDSDPVSEEARIRRKCFIELLQKSGRWPAGDKTGVEVNRRLFQGFCGAMAGVKATKKE